MATYDDCRDCKKFKGDCGNHHVDIAGHIIYSIPSEAYMEDVIGTHGSCFIPSEEYIRSLKNKRIDYIIENYSAQDLEDALAVIRHRKQTPMEPVNQSYAGHDCTTIGYCPVCGEQVLDGIGGGDKKCDHCGQALLWK